MSKICVKGTNVFSGYYKDFDTYRQQMDNDNWFHTGDIGKFTNVNQFPLISNEQSNSN